MRIWYYFTEHLVVFSSEKNDNSSFTRLFFADKFHQSAGVISPSVRPVVSSLLLMETRQSLSVSDKWWKSSWVLATFSNIFYIYYNYCFIYIVFRRGFRSLVLNECSCQHQFNCFSNSLAAVYFCVIIVQPTREIFTNLSALRFPDNS